MVRTMAGGARPLVVLVVHFYLIVLVVARRNLTSTWGYSVQVNYTAQAPSPNSSSLSSWSLALKINNTNDLDPSPSPSPLPSLTPSPSPVPSPPPSPQPSSDDNSTDPPRRGGFRKTVNNALRKIRAANVREFIYEHNKVRQQFNEPALVWDRKLARFAQRFANKRKEKCDMIHSGGDYGESIYWGQHYDRHSAADAVRAWAGEGEYYDINNHTCLAPNHMCGHYTQIIWKTSKRMGCARTKCNNGGVYIICVYDPPGNWKNEDPLTGMAEGTT